MFGLNGTLRVHNVCTSPYGKKKKNGKLWLQHLRVSNDRPSECVINSSIENDLFKHYGNFPPSSYRHIAHSLRHSRILWAEVTMRIDIRIRQTWFNHIFFATISDSAVYCIRPGKQVGRRWRNKKNSQQKICFIIESITFHNQFFFKYS